MQKKMKKSVSNPFWPTWGCIFIFLPVTDINSSITEWFVVTWRKTLIPTFVYSWVTGSVFFHHLFSCDHIMGPCASGASPPFHFCVLPLAHMEPPLQASWATHCSHYLLRVSPLPYLTLPNGLLDVSVPLDIQQTVTSSFSLKCHFN